jgi:DNA-binding transcriptional LysR family regulator
MGEAMELRQLRYFLRVAETLHFGRAAEAEHTAQSAVSTQIAHLETELGVRLFHRSSRSVVLTPAGAALREYAERIFADVSEGMAAARAEGRPAMTHLRVGSFTSDVFMHEIFEAFRARFPSVALTFVELTMVNQLGKLINGDVDLAFLWLPISDSRLRVDPLYSDSLVAALPAQHPLAGASHVRAEELVDEPFAIAAEGASAEWRSHWALDEWRGRGPLVGAEVESVREVLAAIAYGGAVDTATLHSAAQFPHPGVRYVPVADAAPSTMALVTRKDSTSLPAEAFRAVAQETVRRLSVPGSNSPQLPFAEPPH